MESNSLGIIVLIFIIPIILLKLSLRNRSKQLPPGPLALPIIGHLHLFRSLPHQTLHRLSKLHGPLMQLRFGSVPCVVASSPEIAKEFLQTNESSFANRPNSIAVQYLSYGGQDFIFAPYGPYWKFLKKVSMSELLGGQTLDLLLPVRHDELRLFVEVLLGKANASEAVDVTFELNRLTNNVVSRMVMRRRCSENANEAEDIQKSIKDIGEIVGMWNLSDYIWFFKNIDVQGMRKMSRDVLSRFDSMIEKIIVEHEEARMKKNKESENVKDLLDILLDISQDQTSEVKLSRDGIKAFILDMFSAGTDSAAALIEWALAELINNPDMMEKATREIGSAVGSHRLVQESDIENLPYLQTIVKETLRLHSGPIIPRESSKDCEVGGYHIPAKTRLLINVWAIGRDPNHWENPLEFRPERFSGNGKNVDVRGQHFQMLAFGSGRRTCPGLSLGLQMVQTTLAAMIQCFEWKSEGNNGKVDMEEGSGATLVRASPLVCLPAARHDSLPMLVS